LQNDELRRATDGRNRQVRVKERQDMFSRLMQFLTTDIWRLRLKHYPRSKSFLLRLLRTFLLSIRGFVEDKCKFRASALTFFTLLSIVPVIAMMFGIAKGFGLEKKLQAEIMGRMQGQEEVVGRIINFSNSLLENASGGFIAGVGVVFLFWAVIKVLSNIENSFNDIWGVKQPRSFGRKFSDYLSLVLICPFLLVLSSGLTVVVSSKILEIIQGYAFFRFLGPVVKLLLKMLPYCMVWIVFTFLFIFMPNTRVKFKSGLLAGIVAGTIFQVVQWAYIKFQIGAARYGAIYGSFAALPLFLLWLQASWLVVLFGAELSFAHQNVETYEFEPDCLRASYSFKKIISLLISHRLVKGFCEGDKPMNASEISHLLEIPIRLVRLVLFELVEAGVLSEVRAGDGRDVAYQPAVDVSKLTVEYVVKALEERGKADVPVAETGDLKKISGYLGTFEKEIKKSPANVLLKDI
jgi:membrane protein